MAEVPSGGAPLTHAHILVVDDEEAIRRSLARILTRAGYKCTTAADAHEARAMLALQPIQVMLCDVTMPGENGFSLLAFVANAYPEVAVIMVTAVDSPSAAEPAAEYGAYGYIIKPFDNSAILINIAAALHRRAAMLAQKEHGQQLEAEMASRTSELGDALRRLAEDSRALSASQEETVTRLAVAAEWRDPDTGAHLDRMSAYAAHLAEMAGLPHEHVDAIRIASQMHDIGKVGIPDAVLLKEGPFTAEERAVMQTHAQIGYQMLQGSDSPIIQLAAVIALSHHERFDGTGYPTGLSGSDIPIEGRIVAIADVYDALRSERPYKKAFSMEDTLDILRDGSGSHFDPELLELFLHDMEAHATT